MMEIPIGGMFVWPSNRLPGSHFAFAQGQLYNRNEYSQLFAEIGTIWGIGDGSTTFAVPNMRDRFAKGASATVPVGRINAGSFTGSGSLTVDNLPSHSHPHTLTMPTHLHSVSSSVSDPGHTHGGADFWRSVGGVLVVASGANYEANGSQSVPAATTGITISVSVGAPTTLPAIDGAIGATGSGAPFTITGNAEPPSASVNWVIRIR